MASRNRVSTQYLECVQMYPETDVLPREMVITVQRSQHNASDGSSQGASKKKKLAASAKSAEVKPEGWELTGLSKDRCARGERLQISRSIYLMMYIAAW